MATAKVARKEPNLTECAVCHDSFTLPKILPCGHVICRDCLVTWLKAQPQADCPLCRCVIVDPTKQRGRSVEEMADGLPTDLAMTALVEADTLLSKQHVCCVCDDVAAVALCLQCGDMFCQQCCKMHLKQSMSKHHEVEELSTLTTERLAAHHPATCPDHNEEISKVHCPTHGTSICLLCATTTHHNCPELVSLQSQVGELTAELVQVSDKLTEAATKADAWQSLLDKHVAELQRQSHAALDEMKNICDGLKEAIEARFTQVSDMTLKLVSDFTKKATDLKCLINQKRSKLATHKSLVDLYKTFTEHKHFKDMVSVVRCRLPDLDTVDNLPEDPQLNQKLILTIDLRAVANAEQIISGLGAVTLTPADIVGKGMVKKFNPMTATPAPGVAFETWTEEDINFPKITSIVTGPSCEVLYMCDRDNKTIKLYSHTSNTNSLISTLTLDVRPWAMVLVNDNLLAVTSDTNVIKLIDVTDISKPIIHRSVVTERPYRGISIYNTDNDDLALIVSCGHDKTRLASVDMITMAGQHVRTIFTSQSLPGLKLPSYLHTDTRHDVLYISDRAAGSVFCVQLSTGRVLRQLRIPQLIQPREVCTDSEGNLYVADGGAPRVLVRTVSDDWRCLLTYRELGLWCWPRAVCVTNTSLAVSLGSDGGAVLYTMI